MLFHSLQSQEGNGSEGVYYTDGSGDEGVLFLEPSSTCSPERGDDEEPSPTSGPSDDVTDATTSAACPSSTQLSAVQPPPTPPPAVFPTTPVSSSARPFPRTPTLTASHTPYSPAAAWGNASGAHWLPSASVHLPLSLSLCGRCGKEREGRETGIQRQRERVREAFHRGRNKERVYRETESPQTEMGRYRERRWTSREAKRCG